MNARCQASVLKHIVDAMRGLITEVNMHFSVDGLRMQAMDASHVSLVWLHIHASDFNLYECDTAFVAGVRIKTLHDLIKTAESRDILTLKGGSAMDYLTLLVERADGTRTSNFALKLMDIDENLYDVPEVNFDATVVVSASEFFRICKDFVDVSDSLEIAVDKVGLKLAVEGDMSNGVVMLHASESTQINVQTPYMAKFALRYINFFASALSDAVRLCMCKDAPMCFTYDIGATNGPSRLSFYLAPKMNDDA